MVRMPLNNGSVNRENRPCLIPRNVRCQTHNARPGAIPRTMIVYTMRDEPVAARLLDFLKVERAHVCGHSLGGMVAQQLAASRPERVARLVLAETAFSTQSSLRECVQTWMAISFMKVIP